jgi:hypothetical protein
MKTSNWNNFIRYHRAFDDYYKGLSPIIPGVECPDFNSIVFRKVGGPSSVSMDHHPPNKMFRSIIKTTLEFYLDEDETLNRQCSTLDIPRVVQDVIHQCKSMNFRFLAWDNKNSWYVEVTDEAEEYSSCQSILHYLVTQAVKDQQNASRGVQNKTAALSVRNSDRNPRPERNILAIVSEDDFFAMPSRKKQKRDEMDTSNRNTVLKAAAGLVALNTASTQKDPVMATSRKPPTGGG